MKISPAGISISSSQVSNQRIERFLLHRRIRIRHSLPKKRTYQNSKIQKIQIQKSATSRSEIQNAAQAPAAGDRNTSRSANFEIGRWQKNPSGLRLLTEFADARVLGIGDRVAERCQIDVCLVADLPVLVEESILPWQFLRLLQELLFLRHCSLRNPTLCRRSIREERKKQQNSRERKSVL